MDLTDVARAMQTAYDAAAPPAWPSPRAPMEAPGDDEYERVSDPERYAVVHLRAAAWADALLSAEDVTGAADGDATVLRSSRPGTAPLTLRTRHVPTLGGFGDLPMLDVCLGDPPISLLTAPDCGCDACDWGSASLLDAIDDAIGAAVGGPVVILQGDDWEARWIGGRLGSSASGTWASKRFDRIMETCEKIANGQAVALPPRTTVFVSQAWCDPGPARSSATQASGR
jgi:Family of unknown function (DUF6226)